MKDLIYVVLVFVITSCGLKSNSAADSQVAIESKANYDSLRIELEEMYSKDQEIRRIIFDSIGFGSPNTQEYFKKMIEIDSTNQIKIKEILNKHGWIAKSKIGEKASDAIFYIVQHSNLELMEQYYPRLEELALQGEAKKTHAAMMEDRLLMWQGKKQKYGTQASSNLRDDKTMAIWPIEKPDSVNIFRKRLGFDLTVEENAERMNAEYDRNEKLPESKD